MDVWTFFILAVFLTGFGVILHTGCLISSKREVSRLRQYSSTLRMYNLDMERHLDSVKSELQHFTDKEVERYESITNSLVYDLDVTPDPSCPYIIIHAQIPPVSYAFDHQALLHKDSLDIMAREVSRKLEETSYHEVLKFFSKHLGSGVAA